VKSATRIPSTGSVVMRSPSGYQWLRQARERTSR
jgi:hypothetical protein